MSGHSHDHARTDNRPRLVAAICIVVVVLVVEVVGAFVTGSLALFADAGHMFSDLFGLMVALVAATLAMRPASERHTYGFQRAEVLAALINGLILVVVAGFVVVEALGRLINPSDGHLLPLPMLVVAVVGLVANVVALIILRGGDRASLNLRGAYLEVLGDLLGSIAVIVAAIVIMLTGLEQADAIASLAIGAMIIPRAVVLIRDVVRVLFQTVPKDTDVAEIRRHILDTSGVRAVHDVHVWEITSGAKVFSAHVVVGADVFAEGRTGRLLDDLTGCLAGHFDVEHSTFQIEPEEHASHEGSSHP